MKISNVHLVTWQDPAKAPVVLLDEDFDDFSRFAPYGYALGSERCIVDIETGRYYPLIVSCPDDGLERWTLEASEAQELADEADILALPEALRAKHFPGYEAVADRRARRAREDAEAEARRAEADAKAQKVDKP